MKIAIIGLGVIGRVHAEALAILGCHASVLCDIDAAKAEKARDAYAPDAKIYTDWEKMLRDERPDSVHICTPHYLHAKMTVTALNANINVLCEKPLCISDEEIENVLAAERDSSARLGVCHQNRYNRTVLFLKKHLSDKRILGAHGSVVWQRTADYYASADWRGRLDKEGGGALINQGLHTLDLMLWICGEPRAVAAVKENLTLKNDIEVEDTVMLRCFGDTGFTLLATVGGSDNFPVEMSFHTENNEQILLLPKMVISNGEIIAREEIRPLGKECYGDGHIRLFEDYYRSLRQGTPFAINGEEGSRVVRLILAAYRSNGEITAL